MEREIFARWGTPEVIITDDVETVEAFGLICQHEWEVGLFKRTKVVVGNPLQGGAPTQVVFIEDKDKGTRYPKTVQR